MANNNASFTKQDDTPTTTINNSLPATHIKHDAVAGLLTPLQVKQIAEAAAEAVRDSNKAPIEAAPTPNPDTGTTASSEAPAPTHEAAIADAKQAVEDAHAAVNNAVGNDAKAIAEAALEAPREKLAELEAAPVKATPQPGGRRRTKHKKSKSSKKVAKRRKSKSGSKKSRRSSGKKSRRSSRK
jgi:hypothetical protein